MNKILIFGHKKPDTDSVMSCISLSYLKNKLGLNTVPKLLGRINTESKFILKYFEVKEPSYLNDVRVQIKDLNYHRDFYINRYCSVYQAYKKMVDNHISALPITDDKAKLMGLITIKDLALSLIEGNYNCLKTTYDNIIDTLQGKSLLRFDDFIDGNLLVASFRSTTFITNDFLSKDTILIVGDRHSIIEHATMSKIKLIIIIDGAQIKKEHLKLAKDNKINIITTHLNELEVTKLISLSNCVENIISAVNPISFTETDYLDDFIEINNKYRHTNYPIITKQNICLGLLKISDINDKKKKQVILVDHNEKKQTVDGIDEAEILEIIDHHNLGNLTTSNPINFRNMAVGSTCTIIYQLYKENKIKVPKNMAGLMLSGILSDTLLLQSPTTNSLDVDAVKSLAHIAKVDYQKYGLEMLKAGTSLKNKTKEEIIFNDFKVFNIGDKTIGISQVFTMNYSDISKDINNYINILNNICESNNYYFITLFVTDIIKNGSYVIYSNKAKNILEIAYLLNNIEQGYFFKGIVSRKKQIIPYIMEALDK